MDRLNAIIDEKKLTNYRIAKDLRITEGAVRSWRKGRTKPRDSYMARLSEYLGVHPAWLQYGEKEYAPSVHDEALRIAEKLTAYGERSPEKLKRLEKLVDLFIGEGNNSHGDGEGGAAAAAPGERKEQPSRRRRKKAA